MKQEGLAYFTQTHLTVIGMLLFMFAFVVISVWVFRSKNKKFFDEMSRLPLDHNGGNQP